MFGGDGMFTFLIVLQQHILCGNLSKRYTLNTCSLLYINYISIKLLKRKKEKGLLLPLQSVI